MIFFSCVLKGKNKKLLSWILFNFVDFYLKVQKNKIYYLIVFYLVRYSFVKNKFWNVFQKVKIRGFI